MTTPEARGASLRPEQEVLLLCARLELADRGRARLVQLLGEPLDWDEIDRLADDHQTTALLYHHLRDLGPHGVPEAVLQELRGRQFAIIARQLKLQEALQSIMAEMEAAGAPAVAWKGPVLAHTVYPRPEFRTYMDLDLMIRRADVPNAYRVLRERGFRIKAGMSLSEEDLFREKHQDAQMWNHDTGVGVDLHWGSVQRYFSSAMDCERLWHESEEVALSQGTVRALEPGSLLLALTLHGAKHGPYPWPALKWVTDMEAFLRTYPAEGWAPLLDRAQRRGCRRMLLLGLVLARDLLEAPLPAEIEAAVDRERVVLRLADEVATRMLATDFRRISFAERVRFDLAVRERRRDRLAYVASRLLTPGRRDRTEDVPPPGSLRGPRRVARLTKKYLLHPSEVKGLFPGRDGSEEEVEDRADPGEPASARRER